MLRLLPPKLLDGAELQSPANIQSFGFRTVNLEGKVFVVESVVQDGWAQIFGLREADKILWINGLPTSALSWGEVLHWNCSGPLTMSPVCSYAGSTGFRTHQPQSAALTRYA